MPSQFSGLMIGYSGLTAAQAAQNVTANNIANINTEGYSRQELRQEAAQALRTYTHYGMAGAGVDAKSIDQIRDEYLDVKYRQNEGTLGEYSRKNTYMGELENYFVDNDMVPGFNTVYVEQFFNSISKLQDDPGSSTTRTDFIGHAKSVVEYFNNMAINLEKTQDNVNQEIKDVVDRINSIGSQIASLNKQINTIELRGTVANELRDQRAVLLDELSRIVDVDIREVDMYNYGDPENPTGGKVFQVMIGGACTLVDGYEYDTLECRSREAKMNQSDIDGLYDIYWKKNGGKFYPMADTLSGALKGLLELRDGNNKEFFEGNMEVAAGRGTSSISVTVPALIPYSRTVKTAASAGQDSIDINKIPADTTVPNAGTVVIDGTRYTYSSRSDTELKGLKYKDENGVEHSGLKNDITAGTAVSLGRIDTGDDRLLDMNKSTLPESGTINVSGFDYLYTSWSFEANDDGTGTYTFDNLRYRDANGDLQYGLMEDIDSNLTVSVSESINYMGIPYYQEQLNEFVRCLASAFNLIESKGQDIYGRKMEDRSFFRMVDPFGEEHNLIQSKDSRIGTGDYELGTGTAGTDSEGRDFYTYNSLTAKNFVLNNDIFADVGKMATSYDVDSDISVDSADLVMDLYSLKTDKDKIIFRGCSSAEFLQCVLSDVALAKQSANTFEKNYTIIKQSITNQKLSVSGVDTDEEALNLVKYQHAYELSAKVIQTMTEMYDRLILNTGV